MGRLQGSVFLHGAVERKVHLSAGIFTLSPDALVHIEDLGDAHPGFCTLMMSMQMNHLIVRRHTRFGTVYNFQFIIIFTVSEAQSRFSKACSVIRVDVFIHVMIHKIHSLFPVWVSEQFPEAVRNKQRNYLTVNHLINGHRLLQTLQGGSYFIRITISFHLPHPCYIRVEIADCCFCPGFVFPFNLSV